MFDMPKDTQPPPPYSWFNVLLSQEKRCQAMVVSNEQANLQPKLKKGAGGASLTMCVTDYRFASVWNRNEQIK